MKQGLLLILLAFYFEIYAQEYDFSTFTATYNEFTGGTEVDNNDWDEDSWDDPFFGIPFGFTFQMNGENFSEINQTGLGSDWYFTGLTTFNIISYASDLIDGDIVDGQPGSSISYIVEGSEGDRICKIQYKNTAFYAEVTGNNTANNRINYQIWLYESDNAIEFRFGPHTITENTLVHEGFDGPVIALVINQEFGSTGFNNGRILTGDPANPTVADINEGFNSLDDNPEDGRVYRFSPVVLNTLSELDGDEFTLYPSIALDEIMIKGNEIQGAKYRIISLSGRIVQTGWITDNRVNVSRLDAGMYIFNIEGVTQKFIKK